MNVTEIVNYFRLITDETDRTFLPDSAIVSIMNAAYAQYYRIITDITDSPFTTIFNITGVQQNLDLKTVPNNLLGFTGPYNGEGRMTRLNAVNNVTISGGPAINTTVISYNGTYHGVSDITGLAEAGTTKYILQNGRLMFNVASVGDIQLSYSYYPTINWALMNPLDNENIGDSFIEFHDILSLLAYKIYSIKDIAINQQAEAQLGSRIMDFKAFLSQGQAPSMNMYVTRTSRY